MSPEPNAALVDAPAPPAVRATIAMTVATSFDDVAALRSAWDALAVAARCPANVSFDGAAAWWARYGRGRSLRLMIVREGDELIGVLPMFVERVRLGPVRVKRAAIVGSDSTLVVLDLPIRADRARQAFALALTLLLGEERCDAVRFSPLTGASPLLDALRDAARGLGPLGSIARDEATGSHTVFELPATFEQYLASLDKRRRSDFRRAKKALAESFRVECDVVSDPLGLDTAFPEFVRLHEAQWRAEGKLGHFRDWPQSEAYHLDLVHRHGAQGRAHLVRMTLSDEVVSCQLCHSLGGTMSWVLPARVLREDLERRSLGRLGLVQMIEFAIGAGFRRIEAGIGRYDYKLQFGATEHEVRSIVVASRRAGVRPRLAAFARLASWLDAAYYRGWFKRIAPKLPLPRRPLWGLWIRTRP